jgi:hypothetical protein
MAHEVDDDHARKRELDIENGQPVEAKDDEDDETDE